MSHILWALFKGARRREPARKQATLRRVDPEKLVKGRTVANQSAAPHQAERDARPQNQKLFRFPLWSCFGFFSTGNPALVVFGQLKQTLFDERVCLIRQLPNGLGALFAEFVVHLLKPD
jgi:hypothetical protein